MLISKKIYCEFALNFQSFQRILSTLFVHPISCQKQLKTAIAVENSIAIAVFINTFCPITQQVPVISFNNQQKSKVALNHPAFCLFLSLLYYSAISESITSSFTAAFLSYAFIISTDFEVFPMRIPPQNLPFRKNIFL